MERKTAGFTLIESAVTVSVMSILVVLAFRPFVAFLEQQRAAATMASLVSQMSHARLAAVKHRHPTVLCPSVDGLQCLLGGDWSGGWMMFVDRDNLRRPSLPADVLQVELSPGTPHLRVYSSTGRSHLRYLPDGRSAGANLTINVCTLQGMRVGAVIVNNAGRPRTERGQGGACP
ncbi:GspH/FimT family pseudopilin [Luteimonas sp. MC1828]|uniref:GspH/FimT family pseudopilin n=1 Tax=Luteimonas sp. MC1828 TaxID=2799787 RepID=UPI0018F19B9F|nr:GspH/FimT family pseudopilin [Luteimonas sp. MC1828]MBJ7574793.1 GspH/FimT family pseudopilin [Luteimonas sp. MC1828]